MNELVMKRQQKLLEALLEPANQETKSAFGVRKSSDCYFQKGLKFPFVGHFHSLAELLHFGISEGSPSISHFTPQPRPLKIDGKNYFPDCSYVKDGKYVVVEIKPRGEFTNSKAGPISSYLEDLGATFMVVSNESILERSILAKNWLQIVRVLVSAQYETTDGEEEDVFDKVKRIGVLTLGEIIERGNRLDKRGKEIALYRLAHQGLVSLALGDRPLTYETEVTLCI